MKVQELKKNLSQFPDDTEVRVVVYDGTDEDQTGLKIESIDFEELENTDEEVLPAIVISVSNPIPEVETIPDGPLKELIEALTIFSKYGNPSSPTGCEHDEFYVRIDPEMVSEADKQILERLGFSVEGTCFISTKYGS